MAIAIVSDKLTPLSDKILVTDMHFGNQKTKGGLLLLDDNGKGQGIHPRWARVWAVGPDQKEVKVGEWILIAHGRWSRAIKYQEGDEVIEIYLADNDAILVVGDAPTDDIYRNISAGDGRSLNFNIPG